MCDASFGRQKKRSFCTKRFDEALTHGLCSDGSETCSCALAVCSFDLASPMAGKGQSPAPLPTVRVAQAQSVKVPSSTGPGLSQGTGCGARSSWSRWALQRQTWGSRHSFVCKLQESARGRHRSTQARIRRLQHRDPRSKERRRMRATPLVTVFLPWGGKTMGLFLFVGGAEAFLRCRQPQPEVMYPALRKAFAFLKTSGWLKVPTRCSKCKGKLPKDRLVVRAADKRRCESLQPHVYLRCGQDGCQQRTNVVSLGPWPAVTVRMLSLAQVADFVTEWTRGRLFS